MKGGFGKDGFFYVVPEHGHNIAGISTTMLFSLFKATRTGKQVTFVRKKIFFGKWLKRNKLVHIPHHHPIYDLKSPYIRNETNPFLYGLISCYFGLIFIVKFFIDTVKYKFRIYKYMPQMPRVGFGVHDIYNVASADHFDQNTLKPIDWPKLFNTDLELRLPDCCVQRCEKALSSLGAQQGKYVCLHIRTPFYKGTNDYENAGFRNSSPENYIEAIDFLISQGITVVRMGDPVPDILPQREGLIDYPNSAYKSDEMDLYLIQNCYFYWGTNSGIFDTALLFGTPLLLVNVTEFFCARPFKPADRFIYKHLKSKLENRVLSFRENFDGMWNDFISEYEWIENSSTDIKNAVEEMLQNMRSENPQISDTQLRFKQHLIDTVNRWLVNQPYFYEYSGDKYRNVLDDAYRFYIHSNYYQGHVCKAFIEKYY